MEKTVVPLYEGIREIMNCGYYLFYVFLFARNHRSWQDVMMSTFFCQSGLRHFFRIWANQASSGAMRKKLVPAFGFRVTPTSPLRLSFSNLFPLKHGPHPKHKMAHADSCLRPNYLRGILHISQGLLLVASASQQGTVESFWRCYIGRLWVKKVFVNDCSDVRCSC